MSNWLVYPSDVTVELDEATRTGKMPFSIVNKSKAAARVVVTIDPGDERVKNEWFTFENLPKTVVRSGATVPFGVVLNVPMTVPQGKYKFAVMVLPSTNDAAEESSVTSKTVDFVVPAPPPPPKKKFPWWIVVVAALAVLTLGIVTWVVWPSATPEPQVTPSPSPSPSVTASGAPPLIAYVQMPAVIGPDVAGAQKKITDAGLVVGSVNYRFGPPQGVVRQSVPGGGLVAKGSKVDLEVVAPITPPVITAPGNNASLPAWPASINWNQNEAHVKRWIVRIHLETCTRLQAGGPEPCGLAAPSTYVVDGKKLVIAAPKFDFTQKATGIRHTGWVQFNVEAIDDFGHTSGQPVTFRFFVEH